MKPASIFVLILSRYRSVGLVVVSDYPDFLAVTQSHQLVDEPPYLLRLHPFTEWMRGVERPVLPQYLSSTDDVDSLVIAVGLHMKSLALWGPTIETG